MQRPNFPDFALTFLTWLAGGVLLSVPSLLNGFPFVYFDSGYYFLIGVYDVEPWLIIWRPILYGLMIGQFLEWGGQLHGFVIFQNLLLSAGLLAICRNLLQTCYRHWMFPAVVVGSFLTPLPWISNFILPDFFSGLIPLFIAAFLLQKRARDQAITAAGTLFSLVMHHSNMIATVFLAPLLWFKYGSITLKRTLMVALILPWLIVPAIHGVKAQSYSISNASHAILFSRFMALGVAQDYLTEICIHEKQHHTLCDYHRKGFDLWQWANATYQQRSIGKLDSGIQDFRSVNWGILTGKYVFVYLARGFNNAVGQIFSSSKPLEAPRYSNLIEGELRKLNLENYKKFRAQKLTGGLLESWHRAMEYTFNHTAVYSVLLLVLLLISGHLNQRIQTYLTVSLFFYAMNGLTIGLFTDPLPRYSLRISWVFFFLLMIQLLIMLRTPATEKNDQ